MEHEPECNGCVGSQPVAREKEVDDADQEEFSQKPEKVDSDGYGTAQLVEHQSYLADQQDGDAAHVKQEGRQPDVGFEPDPARRRKGMIGKKKNK